MRTGRPRTGVSRACQCGVIFYSHPSRGDSRFCSATCYHESRRHRETKPCAMCGETLPLSMFSQQDTHLQSYCSPCGRQRNAEWRQKNRPPKSGIAKANVRIPRTAEERRLLKNVRAKSWRAANMGKVLMWNRLRRIRLRTAGPSPKRNDIEWLICKQDAKCVYCRKSLSLGFEIDHMTPVSRGGGSELENLQLLCAPCNMKKSTKTHAEYLRLIAERLAK